MLKCESICGDQRWPVAAANRRPFTHSPRVQHAACSVILAFARPLLTFDSRFEALGEFESMMLKNYPLACTNLRAFHSSLFSKAWTINRSLVSRRKSQLGAREQRVLFMPAQTMVNEIGKRADKCSVLTESLSWEMHGGNTNRKKSRDDECVNRRMFSVARFVHCLPLLFSLLLFWLNRTFKSNQLFQLNL